MMKGIIKNVEIGDKRQFIKISFGDEGHTYERVLWAEQLLNEIDDREYEVVI